MYDARLMQEEPAYAVQKGALSVSVAPFQAISANASQMTFQVLVPSLNVFVDRKIQLSTALSFTAQLFYSGPRALSKRQVGSAAASTITVAAGVGTLTLGSSPGYILPVGTRIYGPSITPHTGTYILTAATVTSYTVNYFTAVASSVIYWDAPLNYDVVDPAMGVQQQITQDVGFMNATGGEMFQPVGYATAVSSKDLAYCAFPVQSALTNMTATLNDCTVSTNGDTLKEQLLLTMTPENIKQRTTPTNPDVYAWGRDDVFNNSGNFSSYSVTNTLGDLPNGAFPTTWFSDATQTSPLSSVLTPIIAGTAGVATFPFLAAGTVGSFNLSAGSTNAGPASGVGWYVSTTASDVSNATAGPVVVPFVNNQPVWTTGFPGGDLQISNSAGVITGQGGFSLVEIGTTGGDLTLNTDVPPFCMVGARLYTASIVAGTVPTFVGWVSALKSGSLGQFGSVYSVIQNGGLATPLAALTLCLTAGWSAPTPMPVFGRVSVVEPLVISPMIWADSAEFQTVGLYGMTNMQFVLNFAALGSCFVHRNGAMTISARATQTQPYWVDDLTRTTTNTGNILRSSGLRTLISDLKFSSSVNQYGPWGEPTLYVGFLTPGPDVTLPLVSTVPYVEFPRYVKTDLWSEFGSSKPVSTNTISLTSIPDMIMLYVKPATKGPSQLDTYIPISKIQVTFDNFSNLCSGFQQFNLYESAVAAGMPMDWHQWRGYTQAAYPSLARITGNSAAITEAQTFRQTGATQLSGGPILLRMGHDITLSPGLAPGCLGNYSIQCEVTCSNPYGYFDSIRQTTITLIAINTGFFETVRGQSAIRKTILNSADVEAATPEGGVTKTQLNRMVGRGNFMSGASTAIQKGLSMANKANEINQKYGLSKAAEEAKIPYAGAVGKALQYGSQAHNMFNPSGSGKRPRSGLV